MTETPTVLTTELTGLTALVTGAARGIGHQIAAALAARGAVVGIVDLTGSAEAAASLVAALPGAQAEGLDVDVRDAEAVSAAVDGFVSRRGRLDILVNNAGTAARKSLDTITEIGRAHV